MRAFGDFLQGKCPSCGPKVSKHCKELKALTPTRKDHSLWRYLFLNNQLTPKGRDITSFRQVTPIHAITPAVTTSHDTSATCNQTELRSYVPLNTKQVISETLFPANQSLNS